MLRFVCEGSLLENRELTRGFASSLTVMCSLTRLNLCKAHWTAGAGAGVKRYVLCWWSGAVTYPPKMEEET